MNTITHLLKVSDVCVVENERQRFDELLAEYEDVNTKYRASLTTEELKYHEAEFHMSDKVIASFKTELYSWLHANKQSDRAQSVISGKTRSSSGKSSKHSSASESKMQQLAKLAALEVSKRFVEKEVQLERCRFESEQKTKELELDKQMAIARAELAVYEQFDVDESCKQQNESVVLGDTQLYAGRYTTPILPPFDVLHPAADDKSSRPQPSYSLQPAWSSSSSPVVSGQQSTSNTQSFRSAAATTSLTSAAGTVQGQEVRPPIMSVVLDSQHSMMYDSNLLPVQSSMHSLPNLRLSGPDVAPQVPSLSYVNQYSAGQLSDPNTRFHSNGDTMDTLLSETLKRSQLPKLDLPVFAGDPIEFQQWLGSFENIIEDAVSDPAKRLHYLMQYTTGSAKMLVSGHALNQTEAGYGAAKAELVKEFGDPYILARAYLKRIEAWKSIPANDPSSLKVFSAFLKNCRGSMPSLRHLQQLNTDLYLQKIVGKLSVPLQVSWRKAVDQLEQSNKDISFGDLVDFIECQARIAKHPVF